MAAQALTPDLEQQVEITAGLIGLPPDEVRPFVLEASPLSLQRTGALQRGYTGMDVGRRPPGPVVVASADHGWRAMTCGRGGRLFGRGSPRDRHADELSYAGIPILLAEDQDGPRRWDRPPRYQLQRLS